MASFKKLDNGKWQVSFYCKDYLGTNKKYKKMGFNTKREAKEYADNFIALYTGSNDTLLTDIFNEFLENKKKTIKINTLKNYLRDKKKIDKFFKNTPISKVDKKMLNRFFNKYINNPPTQKGLKITLNQVFKYAINYFDLKNNPFDNFEMISKPQIKKEKVILTLDEFKEFYEHLKNNCFLKTQVYFLLLYFTGARPSEITGLMIKDIDLENGTISINKTRISATITNRPKTKSSIRKITIPKICIDELKKHIDTLPNIPELFLFSDIKAYWDRLKVYKQKKYIKDSITLHSFRHSHTSYLINKGIDIATISKRLGHSNPNITLGIYSHFYDTKTDKIVNLLDDIKI